MCVKVYVALKAWLIRFYDCILQSGSKNGLLRLPCFHFWNCGGLVWEHFRERTQFIV